MKSTLPPFFPTLMVALLFLSSCRTDPPLSPEELKDQVGHLLTTDNPEAAVETTLQLAAWYRQADSSDAWAGLLLDAADSLSNINVDYAIQVLEDAEQANFEPGDLNVMDIFSYLGYFFEEKGRHYRAIRAYEQALRQETTPDYYSAGYVRLPLGKNYTREGESEKSSAILEEAQTILIEAYETELKAEAPDEGLALEILELISDAYLELGTAHWDRQHFPQALNTYQQGLNWLQEQETYWEMAFPDLSHPLLLNKAVTLGSLERRGEARQILNDLLQQDTHPKTHIGVLHNLGEFWGADEYYERAADFLGQALNLARDYYVKRQQKREVGKIYLSLGELALEQKMYDRAVGYYHHALQEVLPAFTSSDSLKLPSADLFYTENVLLSGLTGKARALLEKHQSGQTAERYLEIAQEALLGAIQVEDLLLRSYSFASAQFQLLEESVYRHELLLRTLYERAEKYDVRDAETLFYTFEKSKAFLYRRQLNLNNVLENSRENIPEAIYKSFLSLRDSVENVSATLAGVANSESAEARRLRQQKLDLTTSLESTIDVMGNIEPGIRIFQRDSLVSYREFQQDLPTDAAALMYFYGEESTYLLAAYPDAPPLFQRIEQEEDRFQAFLNTFNNPKRRDLQDIDTDQFREFVTESRYHYDKLLAPALSERHSSTRQFLIFPDGPLFYLPFEVLLHQDFPATEVPVTALPGKYAELPYLFKNYRLSYAHSASNIWSDNRSEQAAADIPLLSIVPDYDCCSLSAIEEETRGIIADINEQWNGQMLDPTEAVPEQVLTRASRSRNILFHGHFVANLESPTESFLALSCREPACDDYRLPIYRISSQQFPTDLFFAAGCQSGIGDIAPGEGMQNLERVLLFAGVRNVVSSLWEVDDLATGVFSASFFDVTEKDDDYQEALYQARNAFLTRHLYWAPPYYWAGFVLTRGTSLEG